MKILIVCALAFVVTLAEPPVNSRYLPPQQSFRGQTPTQTYGAPTSFSGQRQTDAVFGRRPSSTYGAPSFNSGTNRPSNSYGAPSISSQPTNQYLPPSQYSTANVSPSTQYGAPNRQNYQTPSSQYGSPVENYQAPSGQYNQPSSKYGAPNQYSQPSNKYGAPSQFNQPASRYGAPNFGRNSAPSQQYGAPRSDNLQFSQNNFAVDRAYLPPGAGGYGDDDGSNGEPANYSFEYMVKDEPSGNDFGHRESRQGDRAEGLYYVLLPDGRKQTVEYEADQDGYKPRISYEDTGLINGYRNGQNGYQDYQGQEGY
ncbi:hypothetical protein ACJJTC_000230 [Scirpophaga incertulas]